MVRNEDIRQEFNLFAAVWNTYKALLPVKPRGDTNYWGEAVEKVSEIMRKNPAARTGESTQQQGMHPI